MKWRLVLFTAALSIHATWLAGASGPGTNGTATLCSNGSSVQLINFLGGSPDPGGSWSGPAAHPGTFDPATDAPGVYTYTVSGPPIASATVTVSVVAAPNAGSSSSYTACSLDAPFSMRSKLGGTPAPSGSWSPGGSDTFTPGTSLPGVYIYTVPGTAPCANAMASLSVAVNAMPVAGGNGTLNTCSNGPPVDLFTKLTGTPNLGGAWTLGGLPVSNIFSPGTSAPGTYVYTVNGTPPCPNASANVVVSVVQAPNAGNSRSITVCSNDAPFNMRAQLGGTPDAGGTWSPASSGTFTPGTSVPGPYTYTVAGTPPCANATAVLTIIVRDAPDAGTGRSIAVCSDGAVFNLRDSLGGSPDPGGTWTGPGGIHSGQFQPSADLSGPYTYQVVGQAPCSPASATITVTVRTAPNAGTSTNVLKCSNAPAFTLISQLGGTPTAGGTWKGPGNVPFPSGTFTPGTTPPGLYTYTVTGLSPCTPAISSVNVTVVAAPNAGLNNTFSVCSTSGTFALFPLLGGTPDVGGTWTGPSGPVPSGNFVPGTSVAGVYTYLVTGTTPCANATATVTVTVVAAANAGSNGSVTLCSTSPNENLFAHLGGTPSTGGVWTKPVPPGGILAGGIYKPADPTHPAGTYTYTVTGLAPCPNVAATVQVVENQAPQAGVDGTTVQCSTNPPFNMATILGAPVDAGGTWRNAANATVPATFTPGTTPAGSYRYVVNGMAPCANDTGKVTISVNVAPVAGTNGAVVVCSDGAPVNLITQLGGTPDPGGTWKNPNNATNNGSFIPGPGAVQGGYTYTVVGISPCVNASAVVTVTQYRRPVAGTSNTLSLCSTGSAVNLFNSLGGVPDVGGTWTGPGGGISNGVFLPSVAGTFVYKYKVLGTAPCGADSATVTVNVAQAPNAGISDTLTICSGQSVVDLFDGLGGTPDLNGTWSEITITGRLSTHFFNPGTPFQLPPGNYDFRYTVPANGMCASATATLRVTIVPLLNAGSNGTLSVCSTATQVNLFNGLGGTPQQGGVWQDLDGTGFLFGQYFNANGAGAGTFHFRYRLTGALGCNSDSAVVTVHVTAGPNAGHEGWATFCSDGSAVSLLPYISPAAPNGTWRKPAPGNQIFSGTYVPITFDPGDYTYTVSGTGPCAAAVAVLHISETQGPNPGQSAVVAKCANAPSFNMTLSLGGTPALNGTWKGPDNLPHSNIFVPGQDPGGVYIYTVPGIFPCVDKQSSLTVNVNPVPQAGGVATITVCSNATGFPLFPLLSGAQVGGAWYDPSMALFATGFYVPGSSLPGTYRYRVSGIPPCGVAEGTVTVFETPAPVPGRDTSVVLCANAAAVQLVQLIGGPHDLTGTWTGPLPANTYFGGTYLPGTNTPGTYVYHVNGVPPCPNDSSKVTVAVAPQPNAGQSRTLNICSSAGIFAMVDSLGGSPQLNGTWYRLPSGPASNGIFTPSAAGTYSYRYTVQPAGSSPCSPAQAVLTINVTAVPRAGGPGNLPLCNTNGITPMFPALTGNPQTGGTWSFGGASHSSSYNPTVDVPGNYRYTVQGTGGCSNDTATVTVSMNQQPSAGGNGVITICSNSAPVVLLSVLTGTPAFGGTWRDGNNVLMNGIYLPASYGTGVHTFTYTVQGQSPCGAATAQATIIQNPLAYAGQDPTVGACTDNADIDLFALLGTGVNATGNWLNASNGFASSVFSPTTNPPGTYVFRYVVHGDAPCLSDTATVTINLYRKPKAGVSTAPQLCTNGPVVSLLSLLGGTPDNNGSWAYQPASGPPVPHGPTFNPSTEPAGAYVYTVAGAAACTNSTATVQISLVQPPHAGLHGSLTACLSETAVALIGGLNGVPQPGGAWTDLNASGAMSNGVFNPSSTVPGIYHFRYTVAGAGPCPNDTATVTVTVTPQLHAGANTSATICSSSNLLLTTLLNGSPQPGGTWSALESQGQAGLINGVLNAVQVGQGVFHFRYVLSGSSNCAPDTALLTLTILNGPNAGTDGGITTCSTSSSIDLSLLIGVHDAGGVWHYPGTGGVLVGSTVNPATAPSGLYRYVVPAVGSCVADTAVVNVAIVAAPQAGLNGTLAFCSNSAPQNLGVGLGGTPAPGGSWAYHPASGPAVPHGSTYNPLVDNPGNYVYTVMGQSPCSDATATVLVTETPAPFAGDDNTYTFCSSEGSFQMITKLAGNPQNGGTWKRNGTPPTAHAPTYDPALDSSGVFLYIRMGAGACANDTAKLAITEVRAPQAGTNAQLNVCPTDSAVNLFAALGPNADSTGIWTDSANTVLADSLFDARQVPFGTYTFTYTVPANQPCAPGVATVTVHVGAGLNAGIGGNDTICGARTGYNLFQSLGGSPDPGGVWSEQTGVGAITGSMLNATALAPGSAYPLVYTLNDPTCGQVQSVVLMYVSPYPNPGPDTTVAVCSNAAAFPLAPLLRNPDAGGTWTGPNGQPMGGSFNPATDPSGIYGYHLAGTAHCSDTLARVTILVNPPANAGTDGFAQVCDLGLVQLFPLLGGNAQPGGTWSDLGGSGALVGGAVNAGQLSAGQYHYRYHVTVAGCPSDSSEVTLRVVDGVAVSNVERICNERERTYVVSFTITGGSPASYTVSGGPGTLSAVAPRVFTSSPIITSQAFAFTVDDADHCTPRTVEGISPCHFQDEVLVPESFTPNGDGINDNFVIPGIEGYPDNSIVIFNRWGGEVYRAEGYNNRGTVWDGSSPKALLPGDASTGTYYYVLELGNGTEAIKGFVYLNR